MTEQPYVGVAVSVTEVAYVCSHWSVCVVMLFSSGPLVFCCIGQFLFPCHEVLEYGVSPPCAVRCKSFPGRGVDVKGLHVSLADISVAQVRTTCCSLPACKFSIEEVFGNATILHTMDMAQPAEPALSELCVHAGEAST